MKMNMNIQERNRIVEQHLWCIDRVIRQNMGLINGARLDRDDVYQSLAVCMIQAVGRYDPEKGKSLKRYICVQLKYELLACAGTRARYGFVNAPDRIGNAVVSMGAFSERNIVGIIG